MVAGLLPKQLNRLRMLHETKPEKNEFSDRNARFRGLYFMLAALRAG
jgi:hypothetical protein